MVYSSRMLALLLAVCISIITTLFLSLFESVNATALLVTALMSFSVSYLLTFVVLEFLIFREINNIHRMVEKLKKNELGGIPRQQKAMLLNPLTAINKEINLFADLKQKEIDELKKLEAFRKEFIADVSHELKTPIFAAQGFVHTLLDGAVKDKAVRDKFLKKAAKSLDGLDLLVHDLLTLSQIETGQIRMHFEKVNLYKLAEDVFEQFESRTEKTDIRFRIDSPSKSVMAYADAKRIGQVLTNLISNAIKHSEDGTEVVVHLMPKKRNIIVSVEDSGEGIPPEHIHRIFERFYRVDKSRSREKGGTGLGLAIVKHILEGHDTSAKVQSTPGKGSIFSFKLPKEKDDRPDRSDSESAH